MKKGFLFLIALLPMMATAQIIDIDTKDASVSFDYISENTQGTVSEASAIVLMNPDNLTNASISGTAQVTSLSTDNKMRDKHLKSKDFFHVEAFPTMSFESSEITKEGENYSAKGTLTIKDQTHSVIFTIKTVDNSLVCTATIYALDFDVAIKKDREKSKVTLVVTIPL